MRFRWRSWIDIFHDSKFTAIRVIFFASRCGISGDSRPAIQRIVRFAIRDSVPLIPAARRALRFFLRQKVASDAILSVIFWEKSPWRKRSPAKRVWQKSDRSIRKSDRKVTESVPKTKKCDRTPFAALLLRHPEKKKSPPRFGCRQGRLQTPGSSKWRFAALRFVHSQDIREFRGPNAFKTRLKCSCHLSLTRQTCTWNCPETENRGDLRFGDGDVGNRKSWRFAIAMFGALSPRSPLVLPWPSWVIALNTLTISECC